MILLLPSHQGKEKAHRGVLEHQSYGAPAKHGAPDKRLQQHLLEVDLCSSMQTNLAIPAMPHLLVTSLVIDKKENPIQTVTKLTSLLYVAIPCYYNQLQAVMRRTS
jgi:hypothetical protein